jgi:hypothetical protein
VWEPMEGRGNIEEFLSVLTDVQHLALVVGVSSCYVDKFFMTHRLPCVEQKGQPKYNGVTHFSFH